eukprot:2404018-Rhodomonas_salina.2
MLIVLDFAVYPRLGHCIANAHHVGRQLTDRRALDRARSRLARAPGSAACAAWPCAAKTQGRDGKPPCQRLWRPWRQTSVRGGSILCRRAQSRSERTTEPQDLKLHAPPSAPRSAGFCRRTRRARPVPSKNMCGRAASMFLTLFDRSCLFTFSRYCRSESRVA